MDIMPTVENEKLIRSAKITAILAAIFPNVLFLCFYIGLLLGQFNPSGISLFMIMYFFCFCDFFTIHLQCLCKNCKSGKF